MLPQKKIQFNTKKFKKRIPGPLIRGFWYLSNTGAPEGSSKAKKFPLEDMIKGTGGLGSLHRAGRQEVTSKGLM